jgi:hypothetical protein
MFVKGIILAGLIEALNWIPERYNSSKDGHLILPKRYISPGFVAALAAFIRSRGLTPEQFSCHHDYNGGYLKAIGLSLAVWGDDDYTRRRINAGATYAQLTHLRSRDAVDTATGQINGCLRSMASTSSLNYTKSRAFADLLSVVGELHDNVWSHGLNSGFSTAQRRECPQKGWLIEFALADCGMGFLNELQRAKISDIDSHRDAISWCVQEGHSSKLAKKADPWAQSVPDDLIGALPFPSSVDTFVNTGNHHQGLGLAKLVSLAKKYDGDLYLASGDHYLQLSSGITSLHALSHDWQGVAISLAIQESSFLAPDDDEQSTDSVDIFEIMQLIRG